jgi:hypothetical protein
MRAINTIPDPKARPTSGLSKMVINLKIPERITTHTIAEPTCPFLVVTNPPEAATMGSPAKTKHNIGIVARLRRIFSLCLKPRLPHTGIAREATIRKSTIYG